MRMRFLWCFGLLLTLGTAGIAHAQTGAAGSLRTIFIYTLSSVGHQMTDGPSDGKQLQGFGEIPDACINESAETSQIVPVDKARTQYTATKMANGSVMVVGGVDKAGHALRTTEFWNPKERKWRHGPALINARLLQTASLLKDGRLMVAGGIATGGNSMSSVEIFNPKTNTWSETEPLLVPLKTHSAATLCNGDVLVIGTINNEYGYPVIRTMLWKKNIEQWRPAGIWHSNGLSDATNAEIHIVPQKNGGARVFGYGFLMQWSPAELNPVEYFPSSERWAYATALLHDGRLLLAGGHTAGNATTLTELYDPKTNRFELTGQMHQARYTNMPYQASLSSIVLSDDSVVVADGWATAAGNSKPVANSPEVWDPKTGLWRVIAKIHFDAHDRVFFNSVEDGRVLFFASRENENKGPAQFHAWTWDPATGVVVERKVKAKARANAAISVLGDGRVLIIGGRTSNFIPKYRCPPPSPPPPAKNIQNGSANAEDDGDGDECQDEPAHWASNDNATAELWDSRSGTSSPVAYPASWHSVNPQTILLKNGDVLIVNAGRASPIAFSAPETVMIWNAQSKSFFVLPTLASYVNWPMTEWKDGSLIAWGGENINPETAQWLKRGAAAWEPMPRFPQSKATVIALPSGELLALAASAPHVAVFDENAAQWQIESKSYLYDTQQALIELRDGSLAVVGTIFGNKIAVQIWNPKTDSWRLAHAMLSNRGSTGKAIRLASGAVMAISFRDIDTMLCDIWQPESDSWKSCASFAPEKKSYFNDFTLGILKDGQVILNGNTQHAKVYDEEHDQWQETNIEWNGDVRKDIFRCPDGYVISGSPVEITAPEPGFRVNASTVLSDGTVVYVGETQAADEINAGFFHFKGFCAKK